MIILSRKGLVRITKASGVTRGLSSWRNVCERGPLAVVGGTLTNTQKKLEK